METNLEQKALELFALFNGASDYQILSPIGSYGFYIIDADEPLVFERSCDIPTVLEWIDNYVALNRKSLKKWMCKDINCSVTKSKQQKTAEFLDSFDELKKAHPFNGEEWEEFII